MPWVTPPRTLGALGNVVAAQRSHFVGNNLPNTIARKQIGKVGREWHGKDRLEIAEGKSLNQEVGGRGGSL